MSIKFYPWAKLQILARIQDRMIFRPLHGAVSPQRPPETYGLRAKAKDITASDQVRIHLWVCPPREPEKPRFVVFHGNTGHFGDVGRPRPGETYDPEYRIRLLKAIERTGCGYAAVSLRGYGASDRVPPGEEGFAHDIDAVLEWLLDREGTPPDRIILLGESLGAAVATMAAETMTRRGAAPALLVKIAAFSSMLKKVLELHPDLESLEVEERLRHRFDSGQRLSNLTRDTHIYIAHPAEDETTGKHHSETLHGLAREHGLKVSYSEIEGGHITWNPEALIADVLAAYETHRNPPEKA